MDTAIWQLLFSVIAVAAIVFAAHALGFSKPGQLVDMAEARMLFRLAAGGFEPEDIALDAQRRSAIARDRSGALAILIPHGRMFVARKLSGSARIVIEGDAVQVCDPELGPETFTITPGVPHGDWEWLGEHTR